MSHTIEKGEREEGLQRTSSARMPLHFFRKIFARAFPLPSACDAAGMSRRAEAGLRHLGLQGLLQTTSLNNLRGQGPAIDKRSRLIAQQEPPPTLLATLASQQDCTAAQKSRRWRNTDPSYPSSRARVAHRCRRCSPACRRSAFPPAGPGKTRGPAPACPAPHRPPPSHDTGRRQEAHKRVRDPNRCPDTWTSCNPGCSAFNCRSIRWLVLIAGKNSSGIRIGKTTTTLATSSYDFTDTRNQKRSGCIHHRNVI